MKLVNKMRQGLKIAALVFSSAALLVGVSACSSKKQPIMIIQKVPPVNIKHVRAKFEKKLKHHGVRIIHVGETYRLLLPSDLFFNPGSANLRNSKRVVLHSLAKYIGTYDTAQVQVSGYIDNVMGKHFTDALTAKQAEVVANRLWGDGIRTNVLSTQGEGDLNAVDTNIDKTGRANNRRVEVTFMYRVHIPLYN